MVKQVIPSSLAEALETMNQDAYKIIAGGTDLMVQNRAWAETAPQFKDNLIYLFNLEELKTITIKDNIMHIGAMVPVARLLEHKDTPELLKEALRVMASPAIRNLATLAGNIGNASPAGDTLPILYVLNANIVLASIKGERLVPIEKLILGPRKVAILPNELIKEIQIPLPSFSKIMFEKVGGRKADAISKVSFTGAALVKDGIVKDFRIAFGAVSATILRIQELEAYCIGKTVKEVQKDKEEMIESYGFFIQPINDQRSNKEYRKTVALNLFNQFVDSL